MSRPVQAPSPRREGGLGWGDHPSTTDVEPQHPVAVLGLGLRFPGGDGVAGFAELLRSGRTALCTAPADRWDAAALTDPDLLKPGSLASSIGGFIPDLASFDPDPFGIGESEAAALDPQQRLLLGCTRAALADAAIPPSSLAGRRVGVIIGIGPSEWIPRSGAEGALTAWTVSSAPNVSVARVASWLDLRGPAFGVDAGCASSLVAVHLARDLLSAGACELVIAGGVSALLSPTGSAALSEAGALSPSGRCLPFDPRADGYARGEGCGVFVLAAAPEARRRRAPIRAWILGSGVVQGGRGPSLLAPRAEAVTAALEAAHQSAGIAAGSVSWVEAHGVGTPAADRAELAGLTAMYPQGAMIGAVKATIGHLEWAAGAASLARAILALDAGHLTADPGDLAPLSDAFRRAGGEIGPIGAVQGFALGGTHAALLVGAADPVARVGGDAWLSWPSPRGLASASGRHHPRLSGPSSGASRHLLPGGEGEIGRANLATGEGEIGRANLATGEGEIGRANLAAGEGEIGRANLAAGEGEITSDPDPKPDARCPIPPSADGSPILHLEADDLPSLRALAASWAAHLDTRPTGADLGAALATARHGLDPGVFRLSTAGIGASARLRAFAEHGQASGLYVAEGPAPAVIWMFTGQGCQRAGMGLGLARRLPAFAAALDEVDRLFVAASGVSVRALLESGEPLEDTRLQQPAIFALEWALAETWRGHGHQPDGVIGHSLGEYVAAVVAGALSLEGAVRLVAARARLIGDLPRDGAMCAVFEDEASLVARLAASGLPLDLAAINGPNACTVAGPREAIDVLLDQLDEDGVGAVPLRTSHAFHARSLDPILDRFEAEAAQVPASSPRIPLYSTVDGAPLVAAPDAAWWRRHLREPVRFAAALNAAIQQNDRPVMLLEIGPGNHLCKLAARATDRPAVPSIGDASDEVAAWIDSFCQLDAAGVRFRLGETGRLAPGPAPVERRRPLWHLPSARVEAEPQSEAQSEAEPASVGSAPPAAVSNVASLAAEQPGEPALLDQLLAAAAEIVGSAVAADSRWMDTLDSVGLVTLFRRLARQLDRPIPAHLAFEHVTPAALANALAARSRAPTAPPPAPPNTPGSKLPPPPPSPQKPSFFQPEARSPKPDTSPVIVLVGVGLRLPGGVDSPAALAGLLGGPPVPTRTLGGGAPPARRILPSNAPDHGLHPEHHLLLTLAREALASANIRPETLAQSGTGVWMARVGADGLGPTPTDAVSLVAGLGAGAAGRVSWSLDLRGPSLTIDAACAGSLVAIHEASRALRHGECELALAGGATLIDARGSALLATSGALSASGRSRTFSADADGYGRADGGVVFVLERLEDARRHGHGVLAILRGSAVGHDGRGAAYTAPNGAAQRAVMARALADAGVSAAEVGWVEAHGTGTPLGDPVEISALDEVYGEARSQPIPVSALKARIGHTEAAAGAAGVASAIVVANMSLRPAQILEGTLHPDVASARGVEVPETRSPWPPGRRLVAVSAFGLTGTLAHAILERGDPLDLRPSSRRPGPDLSGTLGALLGAPTTSLPPDRPLHELGLDSLAAVSLAHRLGTRPDTLLRSTLREVHAGGAPTVALPIALALPPGIPLEAVEATVRHLSADHRVLVWQAPSIDTVTHLAEGFMTAARGLGTPLILAGWSLGGTIAAVAASRLPGVAGVVVLDGHGEPEEPDEAALLSLFTGSLGLRTRAPLTVPTTRPIRRALRALLEDSIDLGLFPPDTREEEFEAVWEQFCVGLCSSVRLAREADAQLSAPLVVLRAQDGPIDAVNDAGWSGRAPRVRVHEVPGDHFGMWRSPEGLARTMRAAIQSFSENA